ncbi:hypothetical protein DUNSADRAFT_4966 [Dunaliella salina]|uniref:Uncharacterized protein n=1 Tax=Dunaliella salina TaxID=3046 RepID=A0ABQ7GQZ4_DUNSA|nr:hypothetical protein DUNSADRAFT_4966 [Dunaliella salina]|eukprot:KAF5836993.1 hypothetical protein DUNSADRAFT_4966 [Dunaliella salina]
MRTLHTRVFKSPVMSPVTSPMMSTHMHSHHFLAHADLACAQALYDGHILVPAFLRVLILHTIALSLFVAHTDLACSQPLNDGHTHTL